MEIVEYLQYGFIQRALLCGSFIALLCSTLGVLLKYQDDIARIEQGEGHRLLKEVQSELANAE